MGANEWFIREAQKYNYLHTLKKFFVQFAFKPDIKKTTLWDIDLQNFDFARHAEWLIERVFNRGEMKEVFEIIACYGIDNVKFFLLNAEILEGPGLNLAAALFNLPKEKFRCYGKKLYRQT